MQILRTGLGSASPRGLAARPVVEPEAAGDRPGNMPYFAAPDCDYNEAIHRSGPCNDSHAGRGSMAVTTKGAMAGRDPGPGGHRAPGCRGRLRWPAAAIPVLAVAATAVGLGYDRYRALRLADSVRRVFAARRYEAARGPCGAGSIGARSAEAHYYRAWLALADDARPRRPRPSRRVQDLGFDRSQLEVLQGIYQPGRPRQRRRACPAPGVDQEREPVRRGRPRAGAAST